MHIYCFKNNKEIGETLYETAAKDRELEQSTARIQLCRKVFCSSYF